MTNKEIISNLRGLIGKYKLSDDEWQTVEQAINVLSNSDEDMTVDEYRERMIEAFHNADCDNFIALVSLPTEKEFEHLEWLLKNHYKKQSNSDEDCISRQSVINGIDNYIEKVQSTGAKDDFISFEELIVKALPSVTPKPKYVAVGNVNFDKDELQKIVDEAIPTIMPEIEYRKAHWQNNACSNCGIYNASAYKNWCPNCGCQMTEEIE